MEPVLDFKPKPPRTKRKFIRLGAVPNNAHFIAKDPPELQLDGFLMLEAASVEDPDDARRVVLEGCNITSVVPDDLAYFQELTHLDLGDNSVKLYDLALMPKLQELHLDCNGISKLHTPVGGFPALEVLNLAYNGIEPDSLLCLALLPRLTSLDISHNHLRNLPTDWSDFVSLKFVDASHNSISDPHTLVALGSAPLLTHLDFSNNCLDQLQGLEGCSFDNLTSLSLAHNRFEHEAYLLPILNIPKLAQLEIYGNPCINGGRASKELIDVFVSQRGVEVLLAPPPPPERPPADFRDIVRIDNDGRRVNGLRVKTSGIRKCPASPSRSDPAFPPSDAESEAEAKTTDDCPAGPSFFLTGVEGENNENEERLNIGGRVGSDAMLGKDEDFSCLLEELSSSAVDHRGSSMRSAVIALRELVSKTKTRDSSVGDARVCGDGQLLRVTAASAARARKKHVFSTAPPRWHK